MVVRMMFESYGLMKYYEEYIGSTNYLLRLLSHKAPEQVEPQLGFVSHTDKSFTTVLHQNHVNGLVVETKDGDWIDVDFSAPNSFVVMAGDALMVRIISTISVFFSNFVMFLYTSTKYL